MGNTVRDGMRAFLASMVSIALAASIFPIGGIESVNAEENSTEVLSGQYETSVFDPHSSGITGLYNAPLLIWKADAADGDALISRCTSSSATVSSARPQVVEVTIRSSDDGSGSLGVWSGDGIVSYDLELFDFLKRIESVCVPALRIDEEDHATAARLKEFSAAHGLYDAYVVSSAEVVSEVTEMKSTGRRQTPGLRGVVDYSNGSAFSSGGMSLFDIVKEVNASNSHLALFDAAALTKDQIEYLRNRFVTVWSDASSVSGQGEAYVRAVSSNPNGVVSTDCAEYYQLLSRYKTQNSTFSTPTVLGHFHASDTNGGDTTAAFAAGESAGAVGTGVDVWYVNGEIRVAHDYEDALKSKVLLSSVLEKYQKTNTLVNVELKSNNTVYPTDAEKEDYIRNLEKVMDCYPLAWDNVFFASFSSALLRKMATSSLVWAPSVYLGDADDFTNIPKLCRDIEDYSSTYYPGYKKNATYASADGIAKSKVMRLRGILSGFWTVNNAYLDQFLLRESEMLSTDTPDRVASYVSEVRVRGSVSSNANQVLLARLPDDRVEGLVLSDLVTVLQFRGSAKTSPSLSVVSLDGKLSKRGASYYMAGSSALVSVACTQKMANGQSYTICSEPMTLVGVSATEQANRVVVTWKDASGKALSAENYYAVEDENGMPLVSPAPVFKGTLPTKSSTSSRHYVFAGWKSSLDSAVYAGVLPRLTSQSKSVTFTVSFKAQAHEAASAASCTKASMCSTCGHVIKKKLGHKYKAGICTRCGKAKSSSKVSVKSLRSADAAITVTWKKKSKVNGYRVKWRRVGAKKWSYALVSRTKKSRKIKKLKKSKWYSVRVCTYVRAKVNGKTKRLYGKWSKTRTIRVK